ncbi:late competence development ComFB family protein [Christensenellaceae bacterium OttesenSCG-928-L17]|nr:late competence development ComFB family protein [Christensenellaceae bacterium OttesenSCG-928-L17]
MHVKLVNVTEEVVFSLVDQVIRDEQLCPCEKCRLDVVALTLNELPPKYVVTQHGDTMETFRSSVMQRRVDIYRALLFAVQQVKQSPRHDEAGTPFLRD